VGSQNSVSVRSESEENRSHFYIISTPERR
jgi:hypothetical protein